MARIRTIKPGFFKDEELSELPMSTRLLFIGLWCLADKEGRLQDRPKRIKAELFPYDNIEIDQQLSRLQSAGFINRYEVGEMKVIQIINFLKHQRITGTEATSESDLPEFTDACVKETTRKQQGNTLDDRKGMEGKGLLERNGDGSPPENFDEKIISTKNKKKEKEKEHSPGPEDWNTRPGIEEMHLELPDIKTGSIVELFRITKNIDVTDSQVLGLWSIFKSQNFGGEKFYQSKNEVYKHFMNWCKTQTIKNGNDHKTSGTDYSKFGKSAGTIRAAHEFSKELGLEL